MKKTTRSHPVLCTARVIISYDVEPQAMTVDVKEEIEAGINALCSKLEQSKNRHPDGDVTYKLELEWL